MVFAWGVGWGEPGSLLPEDVETGESEGRSSDGLCRLEAGGTQDARLIAGGRFIGIQSSANEQNAAGDEDGLLPADEYFRIFLQEGVGLQELCVIWTRAAITITGFQSNPGVVLPGAASSAYNDATGTLTIHQIWTGGDPVCYRFLRPEASAGQTLELLPLDPGNPGPALALNAVRYIDLGQRDPITTPDRYLEHFPALLEARWPHNRTLNIVVYGGSTSLGYNQRGRPDIHRSYPHFLRGLLKARYPYAVLNVISSGRYGFASDDAVHDFEARVLDRQPDLILLDFGREDLDGSLEPSLQALGAMVDLAANRGVRAFLTTPPVLVSSLPDSVNESDLNALTDGIRQLALDAKVGLIDFREALHAPDTPADQNFDGGVLSPDGHWLLAKEILKWFPRNPLVPIPGESVRAECDISRPGCSFLVEEMQGATVLVQRTRNLNRFWSTIDMVTPSTPTPFAIELPEFRKAGERAASSRWYRVIQYKSHDQ